MIILPSYENSSNSQDVFLEGLVKHADFSQG